MNELGLPELASPPGWSLALGIVGRTLVFASAGLFALSAFGWFFSKRSPEYERPAKTAFGIACASIIGAFLVLGVLFATQRYEFAYVFGHSDNLTALAYRIAGIWSGQEGSFLLWATCSALFALLTARKTGPYRRWYSIAFAFFLGGITSILAYESPFKLTLFEGQAVVPTDGAGLAPSLQNYWVVIHPPTIFLGFGSLTCLFALAFAALATKDYERWIPIVRPWAIVSTSLVGLGLCMGGLWAYETLGWGGFWMWDPVENSSFVPWCFVAALVHGVIVQATKKKWQMSNLLFASLPFLVFMYGTFLTRSGVLSDTSVHSFAEMNSYALKLLIVLMGGSFLGFGSLWAVRAVQWRKERRPEEPGTPVRRESFYMIGIASLLALGTATMIGMSVPLMMALKGEKPRIVEEPLYHQVLTWIFFPLMLLLAVTPFVSWKGMPAREVWSRAYSILCITVGTVGILLLIAVLTPFASKIEMNTTVTLFGSYQLKGMAWIVVLFSLCVFVMVGNGWRVIELFKKSKLGVTPFLAHIGVAVLMAGLIVSRGFESTERSFVMQDHPGRVLNYEVRYDGMTAQDTDRDNKLRLAFYDPAKGNKPLFVASPGLYYIKHEDGTQDTMVWPHIQRGLFMDTYVSLGVPQKASGQEVTIEPGKSADVMGLKLTYIEPVREGEMGVSGGSIGARVLVEGTKARAEVMPHMTFADSGGLDSHPASLGDGLELELVSLDSNTKSATLRLQTGKMIYPMEVFHKPMTILVWFGTAMMAASGFAAAFYRRVPAPVEEGEVPAPDAAGPKKRRFKPGTLGETS